MAVGEQISFKPHFKKEGVTLPCDGNVGDIYVFTPLDEGEKDTSAEGVASVWFCIKAADTDGRNAVWARVHFDGVITCAVRPPKPPQYPQLKDG